MVGERLAHPLLTNPVNPGLQGDAPRCFRGVDLGEEPGVGDSEWVKGYSPGCSERDSVPTEAELVLITGCEF